MGEVNKFNQFVANDGSSCDAWIEEDVLCIAMGDGTIELKDDEELEQFIQYLRETKAKKIPL